MISSKLSGREKALLYFLLCFAIVILGAYFIILPGYKKSTQLNSDLEGKVQVYNTMLATKNSIESTMNDINARLEEMKNIQGNFFESLDTEIIDRIILGYLRSHNLTPEIVTFEPSQITQVTPYRPIDEFENPQGEVLGITVNAFGSIEDLKLMLNDITANGKFMVSSFVYEADMSENEKDQFMFVLKMVKLTNDVTDQKTEQTEQTADEAADDVA